MDNGKNEQAGPIGVFDSGFGGLTILRDIRERLPQYDYLYLGDNARAPYGPRSFDIVYRFTLDAVKYLFSRGCRLVILACNTASAKALRSIQQNDLPGIDPSRRVLGVIRPTAEIIGQLSRTGHIGVLATGGTVASRSYNLEIEKLHPGFSVATQACPMFVPLVENRETESPAADYFAAKYISSLLEKDRKIDTIILACTHYPLLYDVIRHHTPPEINVVCQGGIVAESLADYMERHPEIADRCTTGGKCTYLTTENPEAFAGLARVFLDEDIEAKHVELN